MLPLKLNAKVSTVRIVDIFFGKYFFFIVVLCLYVVWVFLFVCVCNLVLCSWQEPRFIEKISSVQLQHIITALLFQIWLMQLYGKPHKTAVAKATLDLTLILYYFASGKEWSITYTSAKVQQHLQSTGLLQGTTTVHHSAQERAHRSPQMLRAIETLHFLPDPSVQRSSQPQWVRYKRPIAMLSPRSQCNPVC